MAQQVTQQKQLHRSHDFYLAGVCAGIAEYLDMDPIVMRILAVLLTASTLGIGAVVYLVLWAYIPLDPKRENLYEVTPESAESSVYGCLDCADQDGSSSDAEGYGKPSMVQRLAVASALVILFLVVATHVAPIVSGTQWWQFWPLAVMIVGLCLIIIPVRGRYESVWHALGIVMTSLAATVLPMSLGVLSWDTFGYAFSRLWFMLPVAIVLFVFGVRNRVSNLIIGSAFFVTAFCLIALSSYSVPGEIEALFITMPNGSSLRIALGV